MGCTCKSSCITVLSCVISDPGTVKLYVYPRIRSLPVHAIARKMKYIYIYIYGARTPSCTQSSLPTPISLTHSLAWCCWPTVRGSGPSPSTPSFHVRLRDCERGARQTTELPHSRLIMCSSSTEHTHACLQQYTATLLAYVAHGTQSVECWPARTRSASALWHACAATHSAAWRIARCSALRRVACLARGSLGLA